MLQNPNLKPEHLPRFISLTITLLLPLIVLTASAGISKSVDADHLWWSIAAIATGKGYEAYGAAWNFPTEEEAKKAALNSCRKRSAGFEWPCRTQGWGTHSCFLIMQMERQYFQGNQWSDPFDLITGFDSRREAEAWARDMLADRNALQPAKEVAILECSGAD